MVDVCWRGQRVRRSFKTEEPATAVGDESRRLLMLAELEGSSDSLRAIIEPAVPQAPSDTVGTYADEWIRYNSKANGWKRSTLQA